MLSSLKLTRNISKCLESIFFSLKYFVKQSELKRRFLFLYFAFYLQFKGQIPSKIENCYSTNDEFHLDISNISDKRYIYEKYKLWSESVINFTNDGGWHELCAEEVESGEKGWYVSRLGFRPSRILKLGYIYFKEKKIVLSHLTGKIIFLK